MKLETNDWITLSDACVAAGLTQSTGYRIAKRLGLTEDFFGIKIVRKSDVETMRANKLPAGNPRWSESTEEAAEAALKATQSRMRRIKEQGPTKAEKERNAFLRSGKARGGAAKRDCS